MIIYRVVKEEEFLQEKERERMKMRNKVVYFESELFLLRRKEKERELSEREVGGGERERERVIERKTGRCERERQDEKEGEQPQLRDLLRRRKNVQGRDILSCSCMKNSEKIMKRMRERELSVTKMKK